MAGTQNQLSEDKKSKKEITKNQNKKSKSSSNQKEKNPYTDEIILLCTLVIAVLLLLSNFNLCGPFGRFINGFTFGLFGLLAYALPFVLFIGIAFHISNRGNSIARVKIISMICLFVTVTSLVQLLTSHYVPSSSIFSYYVASSEGKSGGGLLGGTLVKSLCSLFGEIGAYVIIIALIALLFMLITGKRIFASLGRRSSKRLEQIREKKRNQMEEGKVSSVTAELEKKPAKTFTFSKEESSLGMQEFPIHRASSDKEQEERELVIPISKEETKKEVNQSLEYQKVTVPQEKAQLIRVEKEEDGEEKTQQKTPIMNDRNEPVRSDKLVSESAKMAKEVERGMQAIQKPYEFPPVHLLSKPIQSNKGVSDEELKATARKLQATLESFGVHVTITNISCGPTVTRYELLPEQGVKVSKITGLADDIKLNLAAADIRIEAPIPGKAAVGIEVPNRENATVMLRDLIESKEFTGHSSKIAFTVGKDIAGQPVVTDIGKMPHLLIAGATGSGKSVCINTLIMSILYKAKPEEVKLIMIDPKVVELSVYNGIPHLLIPVVTDPKKASGALHWAVAEMTERYNKFAELGVRDLKGYNEKVLTMTGEALLQFQKMPQIVIIVDELADLMMVAPGEVEESICRLAQLARAAGIHLIIATQRPSVNVITGVIKANVPSRIAFSVSSSIDSRTILDGAGAEKLLGKGDMLFFPSGIPKPVRVQGAFVSDKEVSSVVEFLAAQSSKTEYNMEVFDKITGDQSGASGTSQEKDWDDYFAEAGRFIIEKDKASIGMLQRVYKIGYNRAARIMDQLCEAGVVGSEESTKPRKVLMTLEEFEQLLN